MVAPLTAMGCKGDPISVSFSVRPDAAVPSEPPPAPPPAVTERPEPTPPVMESEDPDAATEPPPVDLVDAGDAGLDAGADAG